MQVFSKIFGIFRTLSTLQIALGVSLLLHAVPLTLRFAAPERFNRIFQDTPLEVILVNAKTPKNQQESPVKAQAIAQSTLAGGGDSEAGRATTFLPASDIAAQGDATVDTQRQIDSLIEKQTKLLTQLKQQMASLPAPTVETPSSSPEVKAQEEKRRQLSKTIGEIERRINEENARPKKRYISPSTREEVYAVYYDQLRQKIEAKGTLHFPEAAGKKLYGKLTMSLTVNHDGRILMSEIVRSSGNITLDRRAQAIVNSAGPFDAFNAAMRRKADQIDLTSEFTFSREDGLVTKLTQQ